MNPVQVSEDIVPIGEFKSKAAQWLKHVSTSGRSVVITQNGRAAGVLMSPAEFDRIQNRERFIESVTQGVADADAGRVMDTDALRARLEAVRAKREAE